MTDDRPIRFRIAMRNADGTQWLSARGLGWSHDIADAGIFSERRAIREVKAISESSDYRTGDYGVYNLRLEIV